MIALLEQTQSYHWLSEDFEVNFGCIPALQPLLSGAQVSDHLKISGHVADHLSWISFLSCALHAAAGSSSCQAQGVQPCCVGSCALAYGERLVPAGEDIWVSLREK